MSTFPASLIDCDVHPTPRSTAELLPYLDGYWHEMVQMRTLGQLELTSYPHQAPLSAREDWREPDGWAGTSLERMQREALDAFGTEIAILNPLYGVMACFNDDMAAALCSALNDWVIDQWLDRDPRLRASIVVPVESPALAVKEIGRLAHDKRFVQVLVLCMGQSLLGRRHYWPIYEAAERHGLTIGIHAGSSYRYPPSALGWGSYLLEDYVGQAQAFGSQLASFVTEGVFEVHRGLKLVLIESGFTWLPAFMWRLDKTWRGLRAEVPWVKRQPFDIVRDHVRLTLQPVDAPPNAEVLAKVLEHLGSDEMLLFSTDYPHWQFEDRNALPEGLPASLAEKIRWRNALATYPRLEEVMA